jgi:hypothetical protein
MAEPVNKTLEKAAENASNATAPPAGSEEAAGGLLSQAVGPLLQTWQGLPIYGKVAVAGAAGIGFLAYKWWENRDPGQQLEATDWKEKWENMLKAPVEKNGAPQKELLYKQSNSSSKRCIGRIVKLEETKTNIGKEKIKDIFEKSDQDKDWEDVEESIDEEAAAVTYSVVRGRKKLDRVLGIVTYKLAGIFSNGSNPQAEYFDLPLKDIKVTDQGVVVKSDVHLFKKDGLWQTTSQEGQNRLIQLSWLTTHQNWTESLQKQPEFYSDLNMNISGKKNIENTKSKNMQEYKKAEKRKDTQQGIDK